MLTSHFMSGNRGGGAMFREPYAEWEPGFTGLSARSARGEGPRNIDSENAEALTYARFFPHHFTWGRMRSRCRC